jgi:hypothetical protein
VFETIRGCRKVEKPPMFSSGVVASLVVYHCDSYPTAIKKTITHDASMLPGPGNEPKDIS